MTTEQIKKIVDSGDFCIQFKPEYAGTEKWTAYENCIVEKSKKDNIGFPCNMSDLPVYYSPSNFNDGCSVNLTPESKTVLTLDQWWSVVHGEEVEDDSWMYRKLYTIQDLADGKVACVNDGTVEELRRLFDASGGKWFHGKQLNGRGKYYYIEHDNEIFADMDKPNLPTQSVKDFVRQLEVKEWQPQPGEMVEFKNLGDKSWAQLPYFGHINGWFLSKTSEHTKPILWDCCRSIQHPITPTIDELKQAYAQVHGVDVERIKPKLQ